MGNNMPKSESSAAETAKNARALSGAPKKYRLSLFFLYNKNGEGRVVFAV